MNDPTLMELLRRADDAAPPPPMTAELAREIRGLAAARTRHRLIAASIVLPVLLVGVMAALTWSGRALGQA